jgi:hypothetical protein
VAGYRLLCSGSVEIVGSNQAVRTALAHCRAAVAVLSALPGAAVVWLLLRAW